MEGFDVERLIRSQKDLRGNELEIMERHEMIWNHNYKMMKDKDSSIPPATFWGTVFHNWTNASYIDPLAPPLPKLVRFSEVSIKIGVVRLTDSSKARRTAGREVYVLAKEVLRSADGKAGRFDNYLRTAPAQKVKKEDVSFYDSFLIVRQCQANHALIRRKTLARAKYNTEMAVRYARQHISLIARTWNMELNALIEHLGQIPDDGYLQDYAGFLRENSMDPNKITPLED